ncbi:MAG TPA: tetratricopeptide repeat protein [Chthoniobacteraceae bacterium]|jgi:tetratricopeptide (TPR) repeat protein|nr:tetratricopeptide repeat protein [Chthoniobacteraceae bacterium]
MRPRFFSRLALLALSSVAWAACVHTPPGTNVNVEIERRAEAARLAANPPTPAPVAPAPSSAATGLPQKPPEPDKTELVAEAYQRGEFCAKAGKDEEAIAAFKEAVKIDPTFVDAWTYLAALYEKAGNEKESMNAFKHAKLASTKSG